VAAPPASSEAWPRVRAILTRCADHVSGRDSANSYASRDFPVPASPVMTTTYAPPRSDASLAKGKGAGLVVALDQYRATPQR
jgi:hypothetical protein